MKVIFDNFNEFAKFNSDLEGFIATFNEYKDKEITGRIVSIKTLYPVVGEFINRVTMGCHNLPEDVTKPIEIII
jgi:hypothetical protein